jgi:hypothetical protein
MPAAASAATDAALGAVVRLSMGGSATAGYNTLGRRPRACSRLNVAANIAAV